VIRQGDVVWVDLPPPRGSAPAGRRPAVVLQHDRFNRTRINTTVVAAITSRLTYGALPGNVRLRGGEGGLPRPSVVNVTQIATIDRSGVGSVAGRLLDRRVVEIWGRHPLGARAGDALRSAAPSSRTAEPN
jgi:mRNA interferase MazF